MEQKNDKKHWYDGKLYNYFIDPSTEDIRRIISSLIEKDSRVIDIGCGTGSLAFYLSRKCRYVLGVELSKTMVDYANLMKEDKNISNVKFLNGDARRISELTKERFDYAVFSLSLHEMKPDTRAKSMVEIKKITNRIIIYDYIVKRNISFIRIMSSAAEFLAGKENYDNYKSFLNENGIFGLLEKNGFEIEKTIINKDSYAAVRARWN